MFSSALHEAMTRREIVVTCEFGIFPVLCKLGGIPTNRIKLHGQAGDADRVVAVVIDVMLQNDVIEACEHDGELVLVLGVGQTRAHEQVMHSGA